MGYIDALTIENLFSEAKVLPRQRSHLKLHTSYEEKVQRLLIALIKGSYVEPHFHALPHQWEMFTVLEGIIEVKLYNELGEIISKKLIGEGQDSIIVNFSPRDIHSVECISARALLLEIKEGPFEPEQAKCFPCF